MTESIDQTQNLTKKIFICGSALKGQPDHQNLQSATFLKPAKTKSYYRLHAAENGWHPAIYKVESGGISIPGEVYELTLSQYEYLLATEPPHMYPSDVILQYFGQFLMLVYIAPYRVLFLVTI